MKVKTILSVFIIFFLLISATQPNQVHDFKIRTITAGVTLESLNDLTTINEAVKFLETSKKEFTDKGYEVQTVRIATQNLHELISGNPTKQTLQQLKQIDKILVEKNISWSIGELISGNQYDEYLANWTIELIKETSNVNFSVPISSESLGIHNLTIKVAAEICKALSENSKGGEANFRFTASANVQPGVPFFPAAYHRGENSFAIGLEYPRVITRVFRESNWENAEANLKQELEIIMKPIEQLAIKIETPQWKYMGIDTSPAPGLNASIGEAIEALTQKPFGSPSTLSACAVITKAIKNLDIKTCGYSGLMLPVIEDIILAKRARDENFTVGELLMFSAVSGTGLDVIPIPGSISREVIEGVYMDVATLSIRYFNKPLSARLFPIPGKGAGDLVEFENPYLTSSVIMKLD